MKTAELTGELLDYWVAKAEGHEVDPPLPPGQPWPPRSADGRKYEPNYIAYSTNWAQGGPIIDRDDIHLGGYATCRYAEIRGDSGPWIQVFGETSLIAAMRAKVASVYGDEVPEP